MPATEPDLWRLRKAAILAKRASVEDNPHHAYAYATWIKCHVEELLYEDMWRAGSPPRFDAAAALAETRAVLRIVLHRLTDTIAEDWVAPNHRASQRAAMSQYDGTLTDLIFDTLRFTQPGGPS